MATVREKNVKKRMKVPQVPTVPSDEILPIPNMLIQTKMINSLPNEMLRTILDKLEMDKLFSIRRVCTRWQGLAENIFREKRSILIELKPKNIPDFDWCGSFNGLVDFSKNLVILKMKRTEKKGNVIALSSDFCILLGKLFPQVENLMFNVSLKRTTDTANNLFTLLKNWSSTLVGLCFYSPVSPTMFKCIVKSRYAELFDHINNLTSLKRFVFGEPLEQKYKLDFLNRLEHCTFSTNYWNITRDNSLDAISLLGTNCTSLSLFRISIVQITQLLKLNAPLVKGLTHLRLRSFHNDVLSFVCANFGALQMLDIDIWKPFNADAITDLARLSKLSQLSIKSFTFNLSTLRRFNLSTQLSSVHILTIAHFVINKIGQPFDGDKFCRVLSFVFPNLQQLIIKHRSKRIRNGISLHLDHFAHLCKHEVSSY